MPRLGGMGPPADDGLEGPKRGNETMSAYVVDKDHIDVLVGLAIDRPAQCAPYVCDPGMAWVNDDGTRLPPSQPRGRQPVRPDADRGERRVGAPSATTRTVTRTCRGAVDHWWTAARTRYERREARTAAQGLDAVSGYEYQSADRRRVGRLGRADGSARRCGSGCAASWRRTGATRRTPGRGRCGRNGGRSSRAADDGGHPPSRAMVPG